MGLFDKPTYTPIFDPGVLRIKLSKEQYEAINEIAEQEFRRPEDQARMIISDYIKDYNGTN